MANSPANKPGSRYGFVNSLAVRRGSIALSRPDCTPKVLQGNSGAQASRGSAASEFLAPQ
jgi:hypothetical protein